MRYLKNYKKIFESDKVFSDRDITNMYFTSLGWIRYTNHHQDDYINIEKYFDINSYELGELLEEIVEKYDLLYNCSARDNGHTIPLELRNRMIKTDKIPNHICIGFTPESFEKVGGHKGIDFNTYLKSKSKDGSLVEVLDRIESKLEDFYPHLSIKNKTSNFKGDMKTSNLRGIPIWFKYDFFISSSQITLKINHEIS
jgi:hypothetical protein